MPSFPGSYAPHILMDFCFHCHILRKQGSESLQVMKVGPVSNESMQGEGEVEVGGEPGSETGAADHEHGPVLHN